MPRRPRIVRPGAPHLITQSSAVSQNIFDSDDDCRLFLRLLGKHAVRNELAVWGYCLMPGHFHLIVVPGREDSIAGALCQLQADYARYRNLLHTATGRLWPSRFRSVAMDNTLAWRALAYIERTPVRAAMVDQAELYPWSSAPAHFGIQAPPQWLSITAWRHQWKPSQWRRLLRESQEESRFGEQLRAATASGQPMDESLPPRDRRTRAATTAA